MARKGGRTTGKCPKVVQYIAEAKALDAAGDCWCPCVKDDIPKAEAKLKDKKCSSARYYAVEALKRCTGSRFDMNAKKGMFSAPTKASPIPRTAYTMKPLSYKPLGSK